MKPIYSSPANQKLLEVRRQIINFVGQENIKDLHKENIYLDAGAGILLLATFSLLFYLQNHMSGILWTATIFLAQGFTFQLMALYSHDALFHRRVFGDRISWILSFPFMFVVLFLPTFYGVFHQIHHDQLGTENDSEKYKNSIDTFLKRILFLTAIGAKLAQRGYFAAGSGVQFSLPENLSEKNKTRLKIEKNFFIIFVFSIVALTYYFPREMFWGFLFAVLFALPLVSTLRIVIEHADINPVNPFHLATFYRTGFLSRLLFFWDSGDCHIVHHLFERIPFYRVGKAVELFRPFLLQQKVVERKSMLFFIRGWFFRVESHSSLWKS